MLERLQGVAAAVSAEVKVEQSCFSLVLKRRDGIIFEIVIPKNVLEWSVQAHLNGLMVWTDWADYYPLESESQEILADMMYKDIKNFLEVISRVPMRVTAAGSQKHSSKNKLECFVNDKWEMISLNLKS